MEMNFKDFFNKEYTYAVIGASNAQEKYGFKIVKSLVDANFNVIPINPKEKEIYGIKCYKTLLDIKEKIDVVDFVVPKQITLSILKSNVLQNKNITKVWFQPNTFNNETLEFCEKKKINYLKDFCLLKSVLGKNITLN